MPENKIPEKYKDEPRVTLGGVEWAIPPLSGRRIIRFGTLAMGLKIKPGMPEADMMQIYEAIFTGVSQGLEKDTLTFDQWLDDYPIVFSEILKALPVISEQAGMKMDKEKVEAAGDAVGEAMAEATAERGSSTTGTTS